MTTISAQPPTIVGNATLNSLPNTGILLDGSSNDSLTIDNTVAGTSTTSSTSFLVNNAGTLTIANQLNIAPATTLTLGGSNASGNIISSGGTAQTTGAITVSSAGTVTLSGNNQNTGQTTVTSGKLQAERQRSPALRLPCDAQGGSLVLDNTAGNDNTNRIDNGQAVVLSGGNLVFKGSDQATNSSETISAITGTGNSTATVTFAATNGATVTVASVSHTAGNATDLINGVNLGKNSTTPSPSPASSAPRPHLDGCGDPAGDRHQLRP